MKEKEEREENKMSKYGDCSFCGGEVKEELVELDYRYKGKLYVFRNVPVGVCQQCGEILKPRKNGKKQWPFRLKPFVKQSLDANDREKKCLNGKQKLETLV
jgi:YgiT-type zinc finger domain-containing protein